jgi:hypothetical protein
MFTLPILMSHVSSGLCSGSAQARLIFGSGLRTPISRRSAAKIHLTRNHQRGPEKVPLDRDLKYVTTYTMPTDTGDHSPGKMLSLFSKNGRPLI